MKILSSSLLLSRCTAALSAAADRARHRRRRRQGAQSRPAFPLDRRPCLTEYRLGPGTQSRTCWWCSRKKTRQAGSSATSSAMSRRRATRQDGAVRQAVALVLRPVLESERAHLPTAAPHRSGRGRRSAHRQPRHRLHRNRRRRTETIQDAEHANNNGNAGISTSKRRTNQATYSMSNIGSSKEP